MHLVVISSDGAFFAHLHPPRLAPGRFAIALTPDRLGRYTAYVEIERRDSGLQVIGRDFQVGGTPTADPAPASLRQYRDDLARHPAAQWTLEMYRRHRGSSAEVAVERS